MIKKTKNRLLEKLIGDLGWRFAPLSKGLITRDEKGSKTTPSFIKGWLETALSKPPSASGMSPNNTPYLLCCGEDSNVIAIDCDNKATADIFRALDPVNEWVIEPIDKEGLTLLYKYDKELHDSFSLKRPPMELDLLSTGKGCFMPFEANKTKVEWVAPPQTPLSVIPLSVKTFLLNFMSTATLTAPNTPSVVTRATPDMVFAPLHNQIAHALDKKVLHVPLLRRLTTRKIREALPKVYKENGGYIKPSDIKEGGRNTYLLGISTKIGTDCSVDSELYKNIMNMLNDLLDEPLDQHELSTTIISKMTSGSARMGGKSLWQYDSNWSLATGLMLVSKLNESILVFADEVSMNLNIYNLDTERPMGGDKLTTRKAVDTLKTATGLPITNEQVNTKTKLIRKVMDYNSPFGILGNKFNYFKPSKSIDIIRDYKSELTMNNKLSDKPYTTLKFLEHLIPNEKQREYFIRFVKTKITTFIHSPVILVFTGVQGSGKGTVFNILKNLVGADYTKNVDVKPMLSGFNSWLGDNLFLQCDEFIDKVNLTELNELGGILKSLSGDKEYTESLKGVDAKITRTHSATFVLLQNSLGGLIQEGDRRYFHIDTPTKLLEIDGLNDYGSKPNDEAGDALSNFLEALTAETEQFAYYLATNVEELPPSKYQTPPMQTSASSLGSMANPYVRLAMAIKGEEWAYIVKEIRSMFDDTNYEVDKSSISALSQGFFEVKLIKALLNYWNGDNYGARSISTSKIKYQLCESSVGCKLMPARQRAIKVSGFRGTCYQIKTNRVGGILELDSINVDILTSDFNEYDEDGEPIDHDFEDFSDEIDLNIN